MTQKFKMLPPNTRIDGADFRRTYRGVEVAPGTSLEDILRPVFWAHHVDKLQRHDLIDVVASDNSLDVQVRVIGKKDGNVLIRPLRVYQDEAAIAAAAPKPAAVEPSALPDIPENYIVNHTPKTGWRVWSKVPSRELVRDRPSKLDAINWAVQHAKQAESVAA